MKVIGLTGGIGAGKSTVSDYLRGKGYYIIDTDLMAHEITGKGSPVLDDIARTFGGNLILDDGSLDRKALGDMVFKDEKKKVKLEKMTTQVIINSVEDILRDLRKTCECDIIFVDAPLLFETGANRLTDFVWLVDANMEVRIKRVMERDDLTREQVLNRINNQMSTELKKEMSTEIIDNSRGKEELYQQIEGLLLKYDRNTKGKQIL